MREEDKKAEKIVSKMHEKGIMARVKSHRAPSLMKEFKKSKSKALSKLKK